ncbi:MAG: type II toxin-antitoxin system VapC family toxin, partial [Oceanicoccus sp.]|uniref:PIN domain-containing protein n=1 Tax=Oceanicoccus sp. TaxID=2691044 RepID=UPI00263215A8
TYPVDQKIVDLAGRIYRKWNPDHGIDVNDAILAATAMQTGGKIFSLNTKHYPMPDLAIQRAW